MAMSTRERYLATAVGMIAGLFGLQYGVNGLRSKLDTMQSNIDRVSTSIDEKNNTILQGDLAQRKLVRLQPKSLPSNPGLAKQQYLSWLTDIAEQTGMQDIVVSEPQTMGAISATKPYSMYQFNLTGKCKTDAVVKLLALYYDKDFMHSISALKLLPIDKENPNLLSVNLTSQAIALRNASAEQKAPDKPSGRLAHTAEEYLAKIGGRNPFAPPNNSPKYTGRTSAEIEREKGFSMKLEGTDPDKSQKVSFEILSEKPEGLTFDAKQGSLDWRPKANGEHKLLVRVFDDGIPSKSIEQEIKLSVVDPKIPPPPPAKFDLASQTEVTGLVSDRGTAMAMIRSKVDGKMFQVKEGDNLEVGGIKAKVVGLNSQKSYIELETDGKRWTFGMDISLADAFKRAQ